jgi:hypothetical protein
LFWMSITGVFQSITVWNIHHVSTFHPWLNRLLVGVHTINMFCKLLWYIRINIQSPKHIDWFPCILSK